MPLFKIHCGSCHEFLPTITEPIQALCSDPPYGCRNDCDYTRFTGGKSPSRNFHRGIIGDDQPFNTEPFLSYLQMLLSGFQFFGRSAAPGHRDGVEQEEAEPAGHVLQ
jgi:hypothetical protein